MHAVLSSGAVLGNFASEYPVPVEQSGEMSRVRGIRGDGWTGKARDTGSWVDFGEASLNFAG